MLKICSIFFSRIVSDAGGYIRFSAVARDSVRTCMHHEDIQISVDNARGVMMNKFQSIVCCTPGTYQFLFKDFRRARMSCCCN